MIIMMTNTKVLQLQDLLRSLGIGSDTARANEIKQQVFNGQTSFSLDNDAFFSESITVKIKLTFFNSPSNDSCILRDYRVTLHLPNDPTNDRTQTFDMTIGMPIHLKEA